MFKLVELPIVIASAFFTIGTIIFIIGVLLNLRIWLLGSESIIGTFKEVISTLINPKFWSTILKTFITKIFGQYKLYKIDNLRGIEKCCFVTFYVLVILANHIAADIASGAKTLTEFIIEFFKSPFFPGYIFSELGTELNGFWIAFLFIDNFAMVMVFLSEGLVMYRRFIKKYFIFATKEDVIGLLLPVIWFIFRWIAEAATIVKFGTPSGSHYMFIAYLISRPLTLLTPNQVEILYSIMWPASGFFLSLFFGLIPYTGRLWHAFAGPITMLLNSVPYKKEVLR